MAERTNEQRAMDAEAAVYAHCVAKHEPPVVTDETITDALTDLLHCAYRQGMDVTLILNRARLNFVSEEITYHG